MSITKNVFQFVALILVAFTFSSCGYNSMVELDENVTQQWAQVENVYQRRADLIPNLVNTVKGAANMEKGILETVTKARAQATGITIDPSNLTPEAIQKFQGAQDQLSGALSRLLMTVERYPDLKSIAGFRDLQSQLEGTENRISVERKKFNEAVQGYNSYIRKIPQNLFAGIFGFGKKGYFEADKGADKAPEINFD